MAPRREVRLWSTPGRKENYKRQAEGAEEEHKGTNTGWVFFYLRLENKKEVEWKRATIWPQLWAMHCRSTKINENSSTLHAHHYPDGVFAEPQRPPNSTDSAEIQSPDAAILTGFVCICNSAMEREASAGFNRAPERKHTHTPNNMVVMGGWAENNHPLQKAVRWSEIKTLWILTSLYRITHITPDLLYAKPKPHQLENNKKICKWYFMLRHCGVLVISQAGLVLSWQNKTQNHTTTWARSFYFSLLVLRLLQ